MVVTAKELQVLQVQRRTRHSPIATNLITGFDIKIQKDLEVSYSQVFLLLGGCSFKPT